MTKIPTIKDGIKTVQDFLNKPEEESVLRELLGLKAPPRTEIEVSFFQLCNLRCAMCWQDHDDATGITTIVDKSNTVIEYLQKSDHLRDDINVTMTGGELFEDSIDYFAQYLLFMQNINTYAKTLPGKRVSFTLITSLNFSQPTLQKLIIFLQQLDELGIDYAVATSWDPTGRPVGREISTQFHRNLIRLKEYVAGITTVLTRPTIKALMKGDTYFDLLYGKFSMDFDYYVPTAAAKALMPSDVELKEFFLFALEKYPKVPILQAWQLGEVNPISCGSLNKITMLPDGSLVTCRQIKYDAADFKSDIVQNSNANIIERYIKNNECLSCEHFFKCTMSCFVMNDHREYLGRKELSYCLYKDIFKHIQESKNG